MSLLLLMIVALAGSLQGFAPKSAALEIYALVNVVASADR